MSRYYAPLTSYLAHIDRKLVPMSFDEIEQVIGQQLPASALKYRAWWSNNPSNHVHTKAWLDAGYQSEQVDMKARRVVFRHVEGANPPMPAASAAPAASPPPARSTDPLQGLYGALAGTLTVKTNVDLTAPMAGDWRAETDR